ncbi:serine/threonine-protein kinase S6KL-like isoform X2 [Ctenocephalides felis]|uniref:serine/threonine-protein kinase S6KL-like isoform X2 n=1 Tax=Ctenocephalides felis TaxID=7515 RepID=UPI000E6E3852|nr:serine/threonine-protein kinase S6KL-like isoform X2 [Ctenocephalides felis]
MGNLNDKHSDVKNSESTPKTVNTTRKYFSQLSLNSLTNSFSRKSNISVRSVNTGERTYTSRSVSFWPKTSELPKNLQESKTTWPVRRIEALFLPEFAYKESLINSNYKFIEFISKGAFGAVHKVKNILDGTEYALKILSKAKVIEEASVQQVKDEVRIQRSIGHHKFIVNCILQWQDKHHLYIVSNYIPGGELFQLCHRLKQFPEDLVKVLTAEIAIALDFLHNAGIIYRDLKAENVLLDALGHIKLIDFGLSKWLSFGDRTYTRCGTPLYMAPEIYTGEGYGYAVDWWCLGVLCCYLMTNEYPKLQMENEIGSAKVILPTSVEVLSPSAQDLLGRLLEINPRFRLRSLLNMRGIAFFKGYSIDDVMNLKVKKPPAVVDTFNVQSVIIG